MSFELPANFDLEETLVWYDGPRLAVSRDGLGSTFIAVAVEEDETLIMGASDLRVG